MTEPAITMQFTPVTQILASILGLTITGLLSLAVWYLRLLSSHIAHHKHRGCACDIENSGDAYFPARYEQ
jgi:hypothetical protein